MSRHRLGWALVIVLLICGCRLAPAPGSGPVRPRTDPDALAASARLPGPALAKLPSPTPGPSASATPRPDSALRPLDGKEKALSKLTRKTRVNLRTSQGQVVVELYPLAAPRASQRFLMLAHSGFYNATPVHRVVDGYLAQFGTNWRAKHKKWLSKTFKDDPPLFHLDRGTLAFARSGRNKATTQVIINLRDNPQLEALGLTPFGKVVEGMDVVQRFAPAGDPSRGLDLSRLGAEGMNYLNQLVDRPAMIDAVEIEGLTSKERKELESLTRREEKLESRELTEREEELESRNLTEREGELQSRNLTERDKELESRELTEGEENLPTGPEK